MEILPPLTITATSKFARLQTRNYAYHPSIINGIQRMMLNFIPTYMFDMYLDPEDYDFLTFELKISRISAKHQKFTTLACNTKFPIPMLSLHMSRQTLNCEVVDMEGRNLLRNDPIRKVYFALCELPSKEEDPIARISKPRVNKNAAPLIVYARDLEAFVFTRENDKDPWTYNGAETYEVQRRISEIFVYNGKMALIEHGKHINTLLKPRLEIGKEDPAGSPCRSSYRWVMNPVFKETHPIVNKDFTLRRKIEGQPSAKDMFLMALSPEEGVYGKMDYQNKFGKPYGLDLMFQYNGKLAPLMAMKKAIETFINTLQLMDGELSTKSDIIHVENGKEGWSTRLTVPMNVDVNLVTLHDGKYQGLLDDGINHAVSVKVLEILDRIIGDRLSIWENTAVYYKVPHRLIAQSILFVKLPESIEFDQEVRKHLPLDYPIQTSASFIIIHAAINEVINDLSRISAELEMGDTGN
jgi:hypothetical protein